MGIIEKLDSIDHAITVKELASILHMGKTSIYEMVRRGSIPYIHFGYTIRFDPHMLSMWMRDQSSERISDHA